MTHDKALLEHLLKSRALLAGIFTIEHIRNGKVIDRWVAPNLVVDEGLTYSLDASFSGGSPITNWYLGVYKNNYTPLATDVAASFAGAGVANEANAEIDEVTRPAWVEAGVSSKSITNAASPAVFTFNTNVAIYGAFLASSNVKGGLTGTLGAASKFATVRNMQTSDQLNVVYQLNIAGV